MHYQKCHRWFQSTRCHHDVSCRTRITWSNRIRQWVPIHLRVVSQLLSTEHTTYVRAPIPSTTQRTGGEICSHIQARIAQVAWGGKTGRNPATVHVGASQSTKHEYIWKNLLRKSSTVRYCQLAHTAPRSRMKDLSEDSNIYIRDLRYSH